jgi:hypothetical protein
MPEFSDGMNLHPSGVDGVGLHKRRELQKKNSKQAVFSATLRLCVKKEPVQLPNLG